jgi:hypothetical protein
MDEAGLPVRKEYIIEVSGIAEQHGRVRLLSTNRRPSALVVITIGWLWVC